MRAWPPKAAVLLSVVAAAALVACERPDPPPPAVEPFVTFDTGTVRIETASDTFRITAELARTQEERSYGLMERTSLPDDRGMLFLYDSVQGPESGFWMYRTLIPLDIAFLDPDGRIVAIRRMTPCESPNPRFCPLYRPDAPWMAALEVNRGFFDRHGVRPGDRIRLVDEAGGGA